MVVRALSGADELPLFLQLSYVLDDELAGDLSEGRRRPEWMWVATDGDRLLARAAWWSARGAAVPDTLDFFDVDDTLDRAVAVEIGTRLLRTALDEIVPAGVTPPEYGRFVPPDWRDTRASRKAVETRRSILADLGATPLVERLRVEWRPSSPVPAASGRLRFRSVSDRAELIGLMTRVLEGTLDAHSRADLERLSPDEAAAKHFDDEFAGFTSPRAWWRMGELDSREPVGFIIPARNAYNAIIAYAGVLPPHRGHGYVDDLLAEGTRVLAAEGVPRIRAATDLDNVPMAEAFERAGYINFQRALNTTW